MIRALRRIIGRQATTGGVARSDKRNKAGVGFQVPDDGSVFGITSGIDWEIADPSGLA